MNALERAQDHHRDACLDNHEYDDCVAIQLAEKLNLLEQQILATAAALKPDTQYREGLIDGLWRAARIVKS